MRAIWTITLALCLAATSAARAPQLDVRDRRAPEERIASAPAAVPHAVAARRRATAPPDRAFSPLATPVAPFQLAPPRVAAVAAAFVVTDRPARPLVLPRSSRGPPPG